MVQLLKVILVLALVQLELINFSSRTLWELEDLCAEFKILLKLIHRNRFSVHELDIDLGVVFSKRIM
jgi:hypothetical protein